jgi:septum formation protein
MTGFWLAPVPLVLASKSPARRAMLEAAGLPLEIVPAAVDERAIEQRQGRRRPADVALVLAREKALEVAGRQPGRIIVAADQMLSLGSEIFAKPADRAAVRAQLAALRGQTHELHSAAVLLRDGAVVFEHCDTARLTMRSFSDSFVERYLDAAGDGAAQSVGGYQLERAGVHLFERIEGDFFTILGLPLMPLLRFMRRSRLVAE